MLLYVAAGQVFTSLEKAVAAAKGNSDAVKSFSDFFSAEEFASGGACDAASTTAAFLADSKDVTPPPTQQNVMWAPVPETKRPRFDSQRNFQPFETPRYTVASERIRAALATWEPHPDFAASLTFSRPRGEDGKTGSSGAHVYDEHQEAALCAAMRGESFLLTGSAGTGKSYVLKRIIREMRKSGKRVTVTASTGCAAVGIQGSTLHSALKLGIGTDSVTRLCSNMRSKRLQATRVELLNMNVLVIDEISMIDKELFETAAALVRSARCREKSHPVKCNLCPLFGGVQVIVCGDFFQLPPVPDRNSVKEVEFCFQSKVFKRIITSVHRLRLVHRQDDWHFVGMLNELRRGIVTPSTQRVLAACRVPPGIRHEELDERGNPVCFTKLFPYREQVRRENNGCLQKLHSQAVLYQCSVMTQPGANRRAVDAGVKNLRVDEMIELREGCRVLCMKNIDVAGGICNGSPGRIVGFYPAELSQNELADLEWGAGSAKNVDRDEQVVIPEEKAFRPNGIPVSKFAMRARERSAGENGESKLSEMANGGTGSGVEFMRSKEGILRPGGSKMLDDPAKEGRRLLKKAALHPTLGVPWLKMSPVVVPVVEFDNGVTRRIFPEVWEIRAANGNIEARMTQIPLSLGYALSIHKSQGMTLARVQADLGGAFDCGQVYVALSRVSSIDGLRLPSFDARKVLAHRAVRDFEKELDSTSH